MFDHDSGCTKTFPEYGEPIVDDDALGIDGTEPVERVEGGISENCCEV